MCVVNRFLGPVRIAQDTSYKRKTQSAYRVALSTSALTSLKVDYYHRMFIGRPQEHQETLNNSKAYGRLSKEKSIHPVRMLVPCMWPSLYHTCVCVSASGHFAGPGAGFRGFRSKPHLQQWLGFRMQFEKSKKSVKPNERNHYKPQCSTV